ncbi:MAG: T9SS type A sorting domain-containing protein [Flavobacteriales bacterium]|nr:T9SS type A sorting domain-containing protein [Flavobacteriales bacterium]
MINKSLLILFFLINWQISYSQVWVEPGATWHFDWTGLSEGGFIKTTYDNDTVIEGINCQMLHSYRFTFFATMNDDIIFIDSSLQETNYTFVSGDTVFYYRNDQFFILYNFGAQIGDSWMVSNNSDWDYYCDNNSYVYVTDTGTVTINGLSLRTITLEPDSNAGIGFQGTAVEKFGIGYGNTSNYVEFLYPFPRAVQCSALTETGSIIEWYRYKFKCFEDEGFELYNPSGEDCQYHLTQDIPEFTGGKPKLDVYGYQNIMFFKGNGYAEVYSLTGQKLSHIPVEGETSISFNKGYYLVKIITDDREFVKKIILRG